MLQDAAKVTKRNHVVASTRRHHSRLLKYYPRPPCAPSSVKSRIFRPLQTHFLLFQQISFVLVCIHPGTPRVPPRVLASGPKPCGGNNIFIPYIVATSSSQTFRKRKEAAIILLTSAHCYVTHYLQQNGQRVA